MAFYLLAKSRSTGEMSLITPLTYDSRQLALDALSALSADPAFTHADSEVFVADLDVAVPVLVVASARPETTGQPIEPTVAEEDPVPQAPGADAWEAPTANEAVNTAELDGSVTTEEDAVVAEPVAEDLEAQEPPPTPYDQSDAVLDAIIESAEPAESPVMEPETDDLGSALKRAAGALESEGIVAPESVGPASWPWDAASADVPGSDESPDRIPEVAFESVPDSAADDSPVPAVYVPDPLEEPAVDAGESLLVGSTSVDDPGRVVVMGSYAEEQTASATPVIEPESIEIEVPEPPEVDSVLADLAIVTGGVAEVDDVASGDAVPVPPLAGSLTCDDCVYESTCPNKEGSAPATCGNFQWKSV
jgi:hypothetical protein